MPRVKSPPYKPSINLSLSIQQWLEGEYESKVRNMQYLKHEVWDDAVEDTVLEPQLPLWGALLPRTYARNILSVYSGYKKEEGWRRGR